MLTGCGYDAGMLRFTIFGFPVCVEPMFWFAAAILAAAGMGASGPVGLGLVVLWVAVVFVSVVVHELGHAFARRHLGGRNTEIRLHACGGQAGGDGFFTRKDSIFIALTGPAFGLGLAGVSALVWFLLRDRNVSMFVSALLGYFIWINIFWSLVNLLPVLPLDGGRILEAVMSGSNYKVHRVSLISAVVSGVVLFWLFKSPMTIVFFLFLAIYNYRGMREYGGWLPAGYADSSPSFRPVDKPRPGGKKKKYDPKLKPRTELDREHPAVVEIDQLLEKISREGFGSLSETERVLLERASMELKEKDRRR